MGHDENNCRAYEIMSEELKMCMLCRVINRTMQVMASTTRGELVKEVLEAMQEVED